MTKDIEKLIDILSDASIDTDGLEEALSLGDIQTEFENYAGDLAYWSAKHADAQTEALEAKHARERAWANEYIAVRTEAQDMGLKPTEATISAQVESSEAYAKTVRWEITTGHKARLLASVLEAVRAKRDMLVGAGAHARVEMSQDPSIRR